MAWLLARADLVRPTDNYIDYYDCRRPTTILTYEAHQVCQQQGHEETQLSNHHLFQEQTVVQTTGYKCKATKSRQLYTCGTWSHYRLAKPTEFMHRVEITKSHCAELIRFRRYTTPGGESFPLKLNTLVTFSYAEHGVLTERTSDTSCQGESVKIGNHIFTNLMVLVEMQISLTAQHYVIKEQTIETMDDHLTLPCHAADLACVTGEATYIWDPPRIQCPLRKIRTIAPTQVMGTYLYDPHQKVLINKTEPVAQINCAGVFFGTNLRGVYISSDQATDDVPLLEPKYLRPDLMVAMTTDYLAYQEETRMRGITGQLTQQLCEGDTYRSQIMKIGPGKFGRRTGDGIIVYQCPAKVGTVEELDTCHEDIPIMSGNTQMYIDPITRILKMQSPQIPCNVHFPLLVKTHRGYISLSPHLKKIPTPLSGPLYSNFVTPPHEDMSTVSLYTPSEIESWDNLHEFPDYHKALLKSLTIGVCAGSTACSHVQSKDRITPYDLGRLNPLEQLDWIGRVQKVITDAGSYLSALVLVIYSIKIIINICIFSIVLFKEGMKGVVALLLYSCCSHSRVIRRIHKERKPQDQELQEIPQ